MKRVPIRDDGLVGTMFLKGTSDTAIICLGGSSGGLNEEPAEKLAAHGFLTCALAYFGVENLPPSLDRIPIEYFECAIDRVLAEPGVEKVALWGGSRGGELALLLGTLFPDRIDAIAAHVPSSVVFGSLDGNDGIAWTYKGEPVYPAAPFTYTQSTTGECQKTAISVTSCFFKAMQKKEAFKAAAIPVEKIECPLLIISAKDDQMWPSYDFANQIVDRLTQYGSSISVSHISYQDVGHAPNKGEYGLHPVLKRWFAFGGKPECNAKAAIDWMQKTIGFFKENL